jgi:hypothetical protein
MLAELEARDIIYIPNSDFIEGQRTDLLEIKQKAPVAAGA